MESLFIGQTYIDVTFLADHMPQGDEKLYHWVTNWMRYQSTHQTMAGLWTKWVVPPSRKYHLETQLVGTNGTAVPFKP